MSERNERTILEIISKLERGEVVDKEEMGEAYARLSWMSRKLNEKKKRKAQKK